MMAKKTSLESSLRFLVSAESIAKSNPFDDKDKKRFGTQKRGLLQQSESVIET